MEKAYFKEGANGQAAFKDFLDEMIKKRKAFHKYQIHKVCVNRGA